METLELIQKLYHAESGIRRQAALVIGMVEETSALKALEQRSREEDDSNIKTVVMWAGKRVLQAEKQGFSTVDAIFEHFNIDRELTSHIDPEEAELLRHIGNSMSVKESHSTFSDMNFGSMLTADQINTGRLGQRSSDKIAQLRIPPVQPTDTDIKLKIKQLTNSDDPRRQKNAAIALREINNPQALPYLALVYYRNENPENQDILERSGKLLYWNVNYAAMERNGLLKLEIASRRRSYGYTAVDDRKPEPTGVNKNTPGVTDILNQAQLRKKRKRQD